MDIFESFTNSRRKFLDENNAYGDYIKRKYTVPIDIGYVIGNNIPDQSLAKSNEAFENDDGLTEDELIDTTDDMGKVWTSSSKHLYELFSKPGSRGRNTRFNEKQKTPKSDEEYARWGVEFMGSFNYNMAKMAGDYMALRNMDEETATRFYVMMEMYDRLPNFTWNGTRRMFKGITTDPTTYAGLGTLGLGFVGRAGTKQLTKNRLMDVLKNKAAPYAIGAVEGGVYTGLDDAIRQGVTIEAGLQDNLDARKIAAQAGVGMAAGAAIPGLVDVAPKIGSTLRDRMMQEGEMPTTSAFGAGAIDDALQQNQIKPGRIATRFPTAVKATEDPLTQPLTVGLDDLKQDARLYDFNVNITKDYLNMVEVQDETTDQTAERFVDHVKNNLLYLHDMVPPATRLRSQKWYDGANKIANDFAQKYDVPDTSVAGAIAALSPQKDWYQNVALADKTLEVAKNKKDFVFSDEMAATFDNIPAFQKPLYKGMRDVLRGKTYSQLSDPDRKVDLGLKAMFVRLYDQTYNTPDYKIVSPEGEFLETAKNIDGSNSKAAWGSLNEISKAIESIEADGDVKIISKAMGERHKVRNFYNNIYDPNSPAGDVTIDTHAVAAGLLRPLSGNSLEVDHNFKNQTVKGRGTTKGSAVSGINGNYALYVEAYRRAASERGILPRQMQSITWEAVRGFFPDTFKANEKNVIDVDAIWSRYKSGEIDLDETRRLVNERSGGYKPPTWE